MPSSLLYSASVSGSPFENPVFTSHFFRVNESIPLYPEGGNTCLALTLRCLCLQNKVRQAHGLGIRGTYLPPTQLTN